MSFRSDEEEAARYGHNCVEGRCREVLPKDWGEGPWEHEPNRIDFQHAGFQCFIHRSWVSGSWCGYVGIASRKHPAYGRYYDDIKVSVHGGLTYSNKCGGHLCHPSDHKGTKTHWLGFDTGHAFDISPRIDALRVYVRALPLPPGVPPWPEVASRRFMGEHYWTAEEVIKETKHLADQLRTLTGKQVKHVTRKWRFHSRNQAKRQARAVRASVEATRSPRPG